MNYLLGMGVTVSLIALACGIITVGLYLAYRSSQNYELLSLLVVIFLSFIFFPAMWLFTGGTYGSIPYYIIINSGIIALLLNKKQRRIVFPLFALTVAALMIIEYKVPNITVKYDSSTKRYIEFAFGLIVCLVSAVVLVAALVDSYTKELHKSRQYLATLEERSREVEKKNELLQSCNTELLKAKEEAEELNKLLNKETQKLHKLSITDDLTETYNRRFITAYLKEQIEEAQQNRQKLTIAFIDIDNFKEINDTYGHVYGDFVLKRISRTIMSNLRQTDIIGRYGGDEFLIIFPNTGKEEGYVCIERVRKKVMELAWQNDMGAITISGGVSEFDSTKSSSMLQQLDRLLYDAKYKSKNHIECSENIG